MAVCSLLLGDPLINVDAKDRRQRTPLTIASRAGIPSIVQMLLLRNTNPNLSDEEGRTPCHYACKNGDKDTLEALVQSGAWISVPDKKGLHPIHFAAKNNRLEVVKFLKNIGAPLDPVDSSGRTPITLATDNEVKWLLESRFVTTTTQQNLFQIDFVTHPSLGTKSKIGMSMCPGRNRKNWNRKIEDDISVIQRNGIQVVVTLVTDAELQEMGIPDLHQKLNSCDIETVHFPISDKWIPSSMDDLIALVQLILVRIKRGKCILVHCNGGKGRTGLVVTATLVALGMDPDKAVEFIRKSRDGMINPAQLLYVKSFKQAWDKLTAQN